VRAPQAAAAAREDRPGLHHLALRPAGDAAIIEIYPRLYTGKVVKSSAQAYVQHLNAHYPKDELPDLFRGMAAATEVAVPSAAGHLPVVRWAVSCSLLGVLAAGL
jgi:hypothetical protein